MARLLLVDDERDQTRLWSLVLEKSGHQIATAETATEAIEQLTVFMPQVLIMDLRLPTVKEGLELIRKAAERAAMRIVVLSGWPQDLETLPERKLVHRVLLKPVRLPALLRSIDETDRAATAG